MSARPFRVGERILLIDRKKRRYLVTLEEGGEFHTHSGFIPHADIAGREEGALKLAPRPLIHLPDRPDYVEAPTCSE